MLLLPPRSTLFPYTTLFRSVFALSWPALIRSVDARRWSATLISLVALTLSGAYSITAALGSASGRSEEHTSELQSHVNLVCRLLLEKKKKTKKNITQIIIQK